MSNYQQLLKQALTAHENAQQSVRGPLSVKRVSEAVEGFAVLFEALDAAVAKAKSGQGDGANDDAVRDAQRNLAAQRDVLQSVFDRAEDDDDRTVQGVVVNQPGARALADKQLDADLQFLAKLDEVLAMARKDAGKLGGCGTPATPVLPPEVWPSGRAYQEK